MPPTRRHQRKQVVINPEPSLETIQTPEVQSSPSSSNNAADLKHKSDILIQKIVPRFPGKKRKVLLVLAYCSKSLLTGELYDVVF